MTKAEKAIYDRERYAANRPAAILRAKLWGQRNPDKLKVYAQRSKAARKPAIQAYGQQRYVSLKKRFADYNREKKYRMMPMDYARKLQEQNHTCMLCPRTPVDCPRGGLRVDHCHKTQVVRGLLCHQCNSGLGMFQDNPERLRAAADYIERYQGVA